MRRKPVLPFLGIAAIACGLIAVALGSWEIGVVLLATGAVLVGRGGTRLSSDNKES